MTSRQPNPRELALLETRLASAREHFANAPEDAITLVSVGQSPRDDTIEVHHHAALTTIVNTLMNLDEFLVKP
ncbi:MAG: hypothetical protein R3C53_12810 [Pirellulaceae bacterium]